MLISHSSSILCIRTCALIKHVKALLFVILCLVYWCRATHPLGLTLLYHLSAMPIICHLQRSPPPYPEWLSHQIDLGHPQQSLKAPLYYKDSEPRQVNGRAALQLQDSLCKEQNISITCLKNTFIFQYCSPKPVVLPLIKIESQPHWPKGLLFFLWCLFPDRMAAHGALTRGPHCHAMPRF